MPTSTVYTSITTDKDGKVKNLLSLEKQFPSHLDIYLWKPKNGDIW